jgi:1-aminocyclopropane-1-carboxylate deaminase/D-cysteine desulfhydrase-like pyridoxal-dependent ACC family enzyme
VKLQLPTPVEKYRFEEIDFYLKRDDLIHPDFSGNKARKLAWFLDNPYPSVKELLSYGSAQSNAMYSLSVLAKMRGWEFHYYVDHVSSYLKENPHGNYLYALENGMQLHEAPFPSEKSDNRLLIEEGGRQAEAEYGVRILAQELKSCFGSRDIAVFLPSGTGTTALFLQKHLPYTVYTTACVGTSAYLREQFLSLEPDQSMHPVILNTRKKYHFGKLYREFFKIWLKLKENTGITFDLLYDPKGWLTLLENREHFSTEICYIHQGGLQGNESMLKRYERKFQSL